MFCTLMNFFQPSVVAPIFMETFETVVIHFMINFKLKLGNMILSILLNYTAIETCYFFLLKMKTWAVYIFRHKVLYIIGTYSITKTVFLPWANTLRTQKVGKFNITSLYTPVLSLFSPTFGIFPLHHILDDRCLHLWNACSVSTTSAR